jgi:hypothetical protein
VSDCAPAHEERRVQWTQTRAEQLTELGSSLAERYRSARPFPHIVLDDFFAPALLGSVHDEFPHLDGAAGPIKRFDAANEKKLASTGEAQFGAQTRAFMHYLNSLPFLQFLGALTGIGALLSDPYFEGGGLHEIQSGGYLKVHADFNKHRLTGLDRRLNVLVYLNRDWQEAWGGHLELWDRDMTAAEVRVLPVFNRMVVFTTTSDSYHGHPEALRCPPERSRRSLALYYYTLGRPEEQASPEKGRHGTLFQPRPGTSDARDARRYETFKPLYRALSSVRELLRR